MTLDREMEALREAWRDLAYSIFKATGFIRLCRRLGLKPDDWIRERETRDEWKQP